MIKKGRRRIGRWAIRIFALVGITIAIGLLWRNLRRYSSDQILDSIAAVPQSHLLFAALAAAASYVCLTGFDWLALRHLGRKLPYRKVALASFVSLSLGHSIGFAGLSSGPIRYRFYSRWGLGAADVAQLVVHCGITVALGLLTLGGLALLFTPEVAQALTGVSRLVSLGVGGTSLALVCAYLIATAKVRGTIAVRGQRIQLPRLRIALAQVLVGTVNFSLVAACLFAAVSTVSKASYPEVAATYVTGNLLTLLTHVPGGLGVIEGAVMFLLDGDARLIGPLIVFRVAYFIIPLVIGGVVFTVAEIAFRKRSSVAGA